MSAFDRIQAKFPGAEFIEVRDAGQFFNKSPEAAAKLAQRGRFPVMPQKVGGLWMVKVAALAAFIDSPGEEVEDEEASPSLPAPKAKTKRLPVRHGNEKTVRPPSMAEALLALRRGIEEKRAELDFLQAVFVEAERSEISEEPGPEVETPPFRPRTL